MTSKLGTIPTYFLALCILTALSGNSYAKLNPRQESLKGVQAVTIAIGYSKGSKEAGLVEEDAAEAMEKQLEQAGLEVMPRNLWSKVPGHCQLRAIVHAYKASGLDTFIYNVRLCFVQTATLDRDSETTVDATTWELTWLAHGSKERLIKIIPENLEIMVNVFIKDYRTANPQPGESSAADPNSSEAAPSGPAGLSKGPEAVTDKFVASKSSDVFHKSDCRWAENISAENLVTYPSRDEAIKDGKRPCKWCKP